MKQAADLISVLFLSREMAHRAHLKTTSYAQHVALGEFYDEVVDLADEFAEVFQGTYGIIKDVPYGKAGSGDIADLLDGQLEKIEDLRGAFDKAYDKPLQNIIDTVCALYSRTLYKLRNLK